MHLCDCGKETSRSKATSRAVGGKVVIQTVCPQCHPSEFEDDPFLTPADRKIWRHEDAFPHLYTTRMDGTKVAKDEVHADTAAIMAKDPDEEAKLAAIEKKRQNRRTTPMSAVEIEQAERAWRPYVEQKQKEYQETAEYQQKLAEELIQKYVGQPE